MILRRAERFDPTRTMVLRRRRRRRDGAALGVFLGLCFAVALFAGQFTPGTWYELIEKPPWTPPVFVFGAVWTLLYTLMAVAAWLVWRTHHHRLRPVALALFALQLALNASWSWAFFGRHDIGLALVNLLVLWLSVALTVAVFYRISHVAGSLMVPYIAWASFALAVNLEIWRLNPAG